MSKKASLTPTLDMVKEMGKVWPAVAGDSLHPNSLDEYTKTTIEWCRQELILVQLVELNKKFDQLIDIVSAKGNPAIPTNTPGDKTASPKREQKTTQKTTGTGTTGTEKPQRSYKK